MGSAQQNSTETDRKFTDKIENEQPSFFKDQFPTIFLWIQGLLLLFSFVIAVLWVLDINVWKYNNHEPVIVASTILLALLQVLKLPRFGLFNDKGLNYYSTQDINFWKEGTMRYLLSFIGIFTMSSSTLVILLLSFFDFLPVNAIAVHDVLSKYASEHPVHLKYLVSGAIFALITGSLLYIRFRTERSLEIKKRLHEFSHFLRDTACDLYKIEPRNKNSHYQTDLRDTIKRSSDNACKIIRRYLIKLTHDKSISVCIRILTKEDESNLAFTTIGRCNSLNRERENGSESLRKDNPIYKYYMHQNVHNGSIQNVNRGLLLYHNLLLAEKNDAYIRTQNDIDFPNEIKALVISPINGWDEDGKKIIGLLFIGSVSKRILQKKHLNVYSFTADALSLIYMITNKLSAKTK